MKYLIYLLIPLMFPTVTFGQFTGSDVSEIVKTYNTNRYRFVKKSGPSSFFEKIIYFTKLVSAYFAAKSIPRIIKGYRFKNSD